MVESSCAVRVSCWCFSNWVRTDKDGAVATSSKGLLDSHLDSGENGCGGNAHDRSGMVDVC